MAPLLPPRVQEALRGVQPDFLVKGGGPHGAILVGAGVVSAVLVALLAWSFAFGEGAVRLGDGGPALSEADRRWAALATLAFGLANGAFVVWAGSRVLRDQRTWYAGTPEGLLVVTPRDARVEPWASFEDARVEGRDVFLLVPRVGLRGPVKHILRGVEEPGRVAEACRARIAASLRGDGRLSRLLGV